MKISPNLKSAGFTFVELIITLVVAAIVGAMMFTVLGTSMTKSSEPIFRMKTSFELQQVIENFVTAFEKDYAGDLEALKDSIGAAGTSSSSTSKYGQYTVVENCFIKFVSNTETPASDTETHDLLKVTIKNSNNETLTYIFAG